MSADQAGNGASRVRSAPVVIEARDVEKAFRIPVHRIDSFKERLVHPLAQPEYRTLEALKGVSFDVHRGEFFGIAGRNGSGKSTLLKILASIYRADSGTIKMAGRPAPFIELGVGFNVELTARENVTLNGVMMGLSQREARRRLDTVLDFAELEEFVDLKLKNYSSGMLVRLAFSVMIQAEADILLIDEVLAVGDAAFRQKCKDVFQDMRKSDRTVVLVTHDMSAVQSFCHRAMLIDNGDLREIGDPEEVSEHYLRMNFAKRRISIGGDKEIDLVPDLLARVSEAWLENEGGERIENVEVGEPIRVRAIIEARVDMDKPSFGLQFSNADGVEVFGLSGKVAEDAEDETLRAGEQARISATIENPLRPGRYTVVCWAAVTRDADEAAHQTMKLLQFVVFGVEVGPGIVSVPGELGVKLGSAPAPPREGKP